MLFCPNCDNILNISKNPPKNKQLASQLSINTPETVSESDNDEKEDKNNEQDDQVIEEIQNDEIESIINKLANDEMVPDSVLSDLRMEQITKHKTYQKIEKKKKSQILAKLTTFYEKIEDAVGAYYSCKNCMYSKAIDPGSLIVSRINSGTSTNYINLDKLENRRNSKILPITRNYICGNKKCPTNDSGANRQPREAVFYRVAGDMQAWYTCRICGSYWKGQ
jgi:hypothetical protein